MTERAKPPVLEVKGLKKTFHVGFFRKKVEAVRGVGFEVREGEVFGLLGPNGAGKTTTLKSVLRLIFPDEGTIRIFGEPTTNRETMRQVGYMPENPYVYQYLKPLEFLDLCGRLMGLGAAERRTRSMDLLERVGLTHALDRPIGRFSKGMTQRVGIAQALLHDPRLLVLDEPMSGLDPVGRKEMRDLLLEQKRAGKTLVFTSHILSDVETLCDRVVIVNRGRVSASGKLDELLRPEVRRVEVELAGVSALLRETLHELPIRDVAEDAGRMRFSFEGDELVGEVLDKAMKGGARVLSVVPHRETLEDLFVRDAMSS
jgi:ABC-2 type transport system ATP-binding protein